MVVTLAEALGVGPHEVLALVGAGGKTTALFRLAEELRARGAGPVVTTTTRILVPPPSPRVELVIEPARGDAAAAVARVLARGRIPVVAVATTPDGKLAGIDADWTGELLSAAGATHVLVEADGAARKPFKAPRAGEPVIPAAATLVVGVLGIDALGATVAEASHRPELVAALTGLRSGDALDSPAIARVMLDKVDGVMRGAPEGARRVILVNKVDDELRLRDARMLASELVGRGATRIVLAALERGGAIEVLLG